MPETYQVAVDDRMPGHELETFIYDISMHVGYGFVQGLMETSNVS